MRNCRVFAAMASIKWTEERPSERSNTVGATLSTSRNLAAERPASGAAHCARPLLLVLLLATVVAVLVAAISG